MDCSTPGLPVLHCLLEFAQTYAHCVSDAMVISSSAALFSFCLQSFPESGSFPMHCCCSVTKSCPTLHYPMDYSFHCPSVSPGICSDSCCIESVMPSNHPVFCHPLLLLPSVFPSIRVFSNESALLSDFTKSYFADDLTTKNSQKENRVNSWRLWSGS